MSKSHAELPEVDPRSIGLVAPDLLIGSDTPFKLDPDVASRVLPKPEPVRRSKPDIRKNSDRKNTTREDSIAIHPSVQAAAGRLAIIFRPPRDDTEREATAEIELASGAYIDINAYPSQVGQEAEIVLIPRRDVVNGSNPMEQVPGIIALADNLRRILPERQFLPETQQILNDLAS